MRRKPWIVGGTLCLLSLGQAAPAAEQTLTIPEGCDRTEVVAYSPAAACFGGDNTSSDSSDGTCPVHDLRGPEGFAIKTLYERDTLENVAQNVQERVAGPLLKYLAGSVSVTRSDGEELTDKDLLMLLDAGLEDLAPVCYVAAMGTSGEEARPGYDYDFEGRLEDRWHMIETGALDVITFLREVEQVQPVIRPIIAVLDSGVAPTSLLEPVLLEKGWSSLDGSANGNSSWLSDPQGHGTSVAYLAADSAGGFADILSIRVLDDQGVGSQKALAAGIVEALAMDADVLNLSLAWPMDEARDDLGFPWYLAAAFAAATAKDVEVFVAAGNRCSFDPDAACPRLLPAAAPETWTDGDGEIHPIRIVAAGGLDPEGFASSQAVDPEDDQLLAPSEFICSLTSSSTVGESWHRLSGTSFAAPQVSGSFALLKAWQSGTAARATDDDVLEALFADSTGFLQPGHHLNLCAAAAALGSVVPDCVAWQGLGAPEPGACHEDDPVEKVKNLFADMQGQADEPVSWSFYSNGSVSASFVPPDLAGQAPWCQEQTIREQPDNPPCTSCDYCREDVSPQLQLELNLRQVTVAFPLLYLRLTMEDTGEYVYVSLADAAVGSGPGQHLTVTLDGADWGEISEVWLMVGTPTQWYGQPLLNTGTVNSRMVVRCD